MQYGFVMPTGDPRTVAELGHEAEAAGWDGVFTWDGIAVGPMPTYDPWVVMAAIAMRTEHVRIGALVHPLARRRPWKVAREAVTLDHVSGGRLVLPVGLGAVDDRGFGNVGEPTDRRVRAELLDETLDILTGLWTGEPFRYDGRHYRFEEMTFQPPPVQSPRSPIWVVAAWPRRKSMARALRYDGVLPQAMSADGTFSDLSPAAVAAVRAHAAEHRPAETPLEIVVEGRTPDDDPRRATAMVQAMASAGATWWIESRWEPPNAPDDLRVRIRQGPPRAVP